VVAQQAAHRVEHLLVMVAVALQPDTLGVPEAAHLLAMVAAKVDLPQVTVAVAEAVHPQDMAVAVELAQEVPVVPALEVAVQAQED
jgi:hypothetical protein